MPDQQTLAHVFRRDPKNVGDWWSVPAKFLNLPGPEVELLDRAPLPGGTRLAIVGGGGLGRSGVFAESLARLARADRGYGLVAWGVGADTVTAKDALLTGPQDMDALLSFWDGFDLVGTRIDPRGPWPDDRFRWVPCASCLSPLFDRLRAQPPREPLGVYNHLRVDGRMHLRKGMSLWDRLTTRWPTHSNKGNDLEQKLRFLARFEVVVTNSYHGVYWATLLGRKVVCLPFKNGLFSFRHPPAYLGAAGMDAAIAAARAYPDALEECRAANRAFAHEVEGRFGIPLTPDPPISAACSA